MAEDLLGGSPNVMSSSEYRRITGKTETMEDNVLFGRAKRLTALDRKEKAFLSIATLSILATVAVVIYRLATLNNLNEDKKEKLDDETFAVLLLLSCCFLLYFSFHGVLREREFELWAFIAALFIVAMYLVWNFVGTSDHANVRTAKLVRLIIFFVAALPNGILAFLVSREFRWLEFRIVGADPLLQHMFQTYSRFSTLLVFDLQILIYVMVMVYNPYGEAHLAEKIVAPILAAFTFILLIVAVQGVTREKKILLQIWGVCIILEPIYFAWKCYWIAHKWNDTNFDRRLAEIFYVGAAIAIVVRGAAAYYASVCYNNFNQGLKQRAFGNN
ncbi:uncharacterized protein [Oscarella lobularis]|uniref:uncharacterized protein n=1 Tax=Oscarella lobularis TaxID=121494 RepID=UPI003313AD4E